MSERLGFCDLEIIAEVVVSKLNPELPKPFSRRQLQQYIKKEGINGFCIILPSQKLRDNINDSSIRGMYCQISWESGSTQSFVLPEAYSIEPLDKESRA